eukprot:TRINITY_DN32099_c0_g1_i1.p1 TRINITY_DN32099_c0_g1~~TRINITY_DN32099_c0_g1_i1.p1  ORF type:complete len:306 (+),score=66.97 TRINITY_DN32099_c0_g1_i1:82-918(+)
MPTELRRLLRGCVHAAKHRQLRSVPEALPYASALIPLDSAEGQRLLQTGTVDQDLIAHLQRQQHPAFCGVATVVTCVRRLHPDQHATQEDVFRPLRERGNFPNPWFAYFGYACGDLFPDAAKIRLNEHLKYDGLPCGAAVALLRAYGLHAVYHPAELAADESGAVQAGNDDEVPGDLQSFEAAVAAAVQGAGTVVVANYFRGALEQRGTGHFAPVGGLHRGGGGSPARMLVLESNSWRYPSLWAPVSTLWRAIATWTPNGRRRGYIVVSRRPPAAADT